MIFAIAGGLLFIIGLHGLFTRRNLVMRIMAANIAAAGTFVVILSASGRAGATADPVAQAMVLTGIVVAVSVTAFALSLIGRLKHDRAAEGRSGEQ